MDGGGLILLIVLALICCAAWHSAPSRTRRERDDMRKAADLAMIELERRTRK